MNVSATGIGGYKEIIVSVRSPEAYDHLKYESGGHRVQRVPTTEAGGKFLVRAEIENRCPSEPATEDPPDIGELP